MRRGLVLGLMFLLGLVASVQAITRNVSTSAQLTTELAAAVAGDEIVLADGTYSGSFTINGNSGTPTDKITVRAANPHQAILQGTSACNVNTTFLVARQWWVFQDLKIVDHGRPFLIQANNVEVAHNIIEHYMGEGIRVDGNDLGPGPVTGVNIHHNVLTGDTVCAGLGDSVGVWLVDNADQNTVADNIIVGTGNNGYQCGDVGGCSVGNKTGYGLLVSGNSDNNTIQGNLFLANQGKGVNRILGNAVGVTTSGNIMRDNMAMHGEGGSFVTDDCSDDSNQIINNLAYGTYEALGHTKGNNSTFSFGHHTYQHNTFYLTEFTKRGMGFGSSSGCDAVSRVKAENTLKDNLFYATTVKEGPNSISVLLDVDQQSTSLPTSSHNLFWAPGAASTWVKGYSYHANDLHNGTQPSFTDAANGDFSLADGSYGKGAASDGTSDIGIAYNSYLKKSWVQNVFALATHENDSLAGVTSTPFPGLNASRFHQVWFYIPATSPCTSTNEQFTIEGTTTNLARDISALVAGSGEQWIQPGGPQRWITLGRHKATDGTLNISWQHTNCVEKVFIRELPTADEAYTWITGAEPPPTTSALINVGGGTFTATDGSYAADTLFTGGETFANSNPIANTVDDTLYHSERYGNPFSYNIPLENGEYDVTLRFAETIWTAPGMRVMSVSAEGATVISNLDIYATAGANTAYDPTFTVTIADGELNLVFSASVENAKVNAIKVVPTTLVPEFFPLECCQEPGCQQASNWHRVTDTPNVVGVSYHMDTVVGMGNPTDPTLFPSGGFNMVPGIFKVAPVDPDIDVPLEVGEATDIEYRVKVTAPAEVGDQIKCRPEGMDNYNEANIKTLTIVPGVQGLFVSGIDTSGVSH